MPAITNFERPSRKPAPRGRGALSNLQSRFEHPLREDFDDGRDIPEKNEEAPRTQITEEIAGSILTRNRSPAKSR